MNRCDNMHRIKSSAPELNKCVEKFVMNTNLNRSLFLNVIECPTAPQISQQSKKYQLNWRQFRPIPFVPTPMFEPIVGFMLANKNFFAMNESASSIRKLFT